MKQAASPSVSVSHRPDRLPLHSRNIFWLMVGLLWVMAPHIERAPAWALAFCAIMFVWRSLVALGRIALPRRWLLLLVTFAGIVGVALTFRTIVGRDAGVLLLMVLIALKLMESRNRADGMYLVWMGYFLVVTNFLYSQTIPVAGFMLVALAVFTAALVDIQLIERRPVRTLLTQSTGMLLTALPFAVLLFVLVPRINGPLWGMPQDSGKSSSGISDTMSPGSMSELILSDDVAFRVDFPGRLPAYSDLYWRGPVLWDFDGLTWRQGTIPFQELPNLRFLGRDLPYSITLEPHNKRWMFALDMPQTRPPQSFLTADFQLLRIKPVNQRIRYDITSSTQYLADPNPIPEHLERALKFPAELNPRAQALAATWKGQGTPTQIAQRALNYFRDQRFVYTLDPPKLGRHNVDDFLFISKEGFCEHYASSFVYLMRAAGVPARVVTGYLGGEINPVGRYLIVRQAEAHAWAEIWEAGRGWVRVDPTAVVSPGRIEDGTARSVQGADALPLMVRGDFPLLRDLRLNWDSVVNSWNQWVLGYNPEKQLELLERLGLKDGGWRTLISLLIGGLVLATVAWVLWWAWRHRAPPRSALEQVWDQYCRKLGRAGVVHAWHEGPLAYGERAAEALPELAEVLRQIAQQYAALRYATNEPERAAIRDLAQQVRQLKLGRGLKR